MLEFLGGSATPLCATDRAETERDEEREREAENLRRRQTAAGAPARRGEGECIEEVLEEDDGFVILSFAGRGGHGHGTKSRGNNMEDAGSAMQHVGAALLRKFGRGID